MQYIYKHAVPILDEHVIYDEDGKKLATIDEARLKYMAKLANRRVADTGDLVPIVIGHTEDDVPEDKQPEIVGYAYRFRVQKFLKTSRKALTATFRFYKKFLGKIKKYPRRSIELWLNDWKIDPISLLGATTPERDLGLLKFSKGGVRKYRIPYKESKIMNSENPQQKQIVDAVMKAIEQSDWYKFLCTQMQEAGESEEGNMTPGEEEGDMEQNEPGLGENEELADEEAMARDMEDPDDIPEEEEPMRYGAGYPSGTNTAKKGLALMNKRAKMKKDQARVNKHQYNKVLAQYNKQIKDLQVKYRKSEREKDLIQLEAEGIDFDRVEELEDVLDLPEPTYQRHLDKMRKRYSKAPVFAEGMNQVYSHSRSETNGNTALSRKQIADQAIQLAASKHITFEEALNMLQ